MFKKKKAENVEPEIKQFVSVERETMPSKKEGEGNTAEDIRLIIAEWLKEIHVRFKTRYTKRQVRGITKLQSIAYRYFEITGCLPLLLTEYRIAKLSEDGQSSKELVDILKERLTGMVEEKTMVNKSAGRFFE